MSPIAATHNPNFPANLAIAPSHRYNHEHSRKDPKVALDTNTDSKFDVAAQKAAIEKYGIAGRVWEAAYALMLYLEESPYLEFDPPPPFTLSPAPPSTSNIRQAFRIIELGSGTGIVGLKLAEHLTRIRAGAVIDQAASSRGSTRSGDLVILTDLDDVCPLLEENLDGRRVQIYGETKDDLSHVQDVTVEVRPLAWGNYHQASVIIEEIRDKYLKADQSQSPLTHVVCSDLVYFPKLLAPLLRTLLHLTSPPLAPSSASDTPTIIISYKIRSLSKETPFWSAFGLWFSFEPVLTRPIGRVYAGNHNSASDLESEDAATVEGELDDHDGWRRFGDSDDGDGDGDAMFVFIAKRRPKSFDWHIPDEDKSLLEGVGARGTDNRKEDDSFEVMLLMGMDG